MPLPQGIANPKGAFGLPLSGTNLGGQVVMTNDHFDVEVINNSAAARVYGDVVVIDVTGTLATTTTTANDKTVLGVVSQSNSNPTNCPIGFPMLVTVRGVARVNIGANTVAAGDVLASFTTAGQAVTNNALTAPTNAAAIGIALEANAAKDTNNTLRVKLTI